MRIMTVYITIVENDNLDAQINLFNTIAKYLGLMDNNLPDEEIHHAEDNVYYYNQDKINMNKFADFVNSLHDLDINLNLTKTIS